jgi:hypothetical protein
MKASKVNATIGAVLAAICALLAAFLTVIHFSDAAGNLKVIVGLTQVGAIAVTAVAIIAQLVERLRREQRVEQQVEALQTKVEAEPERVSFAWDLARVKLEAYFDRNLSQVNAVFIVAIVVMVAGFALISYAVVISISRPQSSAAYVSAICGIVTEFIGATFMLIYRSTMAQATSFMTVLERINAVGMAVQILDSIPEAEGQLKNQTRSEIVKLLLSSGGNSRQGD